MLIDNSDEVKRNLDLQIKRALWEVGETAEKNVKKITPVDTGNLRDRIHHQEGENETIIGTNVEYAIFVEFGSKNNKKPAHMFQRGVVNRINEYKAIITKWLNES